MPGNWLFLPRRENDQKLWYHKYMRRERITYTGAYHHVMNRGYDGYLIKSIEYLLQNPVRAGIVPRAENYTWSSIQYYFSNRQSEIIDGEYVNQLFGTKACLLSDLESRPYNEIPVRMTKHGEILGSDTFLKLANLAIFPGGREADPPPKIFF